MMKPTFFALFALALVATPAAACGPYRCIGEALADDNYPPGDSTLPASVQAQVHARQGKGLSLAGFYNDPSVALAQRDYGYAPRRRHGPYVLTRAY